MSDTSALIEKGVGAVAFFGTFASAYFYDKRRSNRLKRGGSNCSVYHNRIRKELYDTQAALDANLEQSKRDFSENVHELYIHNEIEREAHALILQEQVDVALECYSAISSLKSGKITSRTPPEISKVIRQQRALETSRKQINLLTFGSRTPTGDETPNGGGEIKKLLAISNAPENCTHQKLTRKKCTRKRQGSSSLVEATLGWFSSSIAGSVKKNMATAI